MFEMDGITLEISDEALHAVAKEALKRNTGARGLRSILENVLMNVMFEVPSRKDVRKCVVTEQCITENAQPLLVLYDEKQITPPVLSSGTHN